ncbi:MULTISPECIES: DLW-39 family protein [Rothia]|nr:DLW-39 family protein [Rothia nasimurium]
MKKFMAITLAALATAVAAKKAKDSQENKKTWEEATDKIS